MERLKDKLALVTGGARGIGAGIARRFSEEGARVIVNDLELEPAQETARAVGGDAMVADVSDPTAVAEMFAQVAVHFGRLDVLVNNAGISGMEGNPERVARFQERSLKQLAELTAGGEITTHLDLTVELEDEEWRRMIAVHLDGTFYCSREAIKIMSPQFSGSIINMGSILGTSGAGGAPHYCAAKAGILGLTRSLARELASRKIRVNAIAPGWIDTEFLTPLAETRQLLTLQTPMGRLGDTDDVAWAAVYLASDEAKFVTGQVLSPNGGWTMSQ